MFKTPVLFIVFNRPDTTAKVFEAIRKVQPKHLYIAADGPRPGHAADAENCKQTRSITENINWECEVKLLFREQNLGCFTAVSEAINWFFTNVEAGIIIEDDCLPNGDFFLFCEEMLAKYKDTEKVLSINGSNFGYELSNGDSYAFSRFMNMWGWATWRRSAMAIDYEMKAWKAKKNKLLFLHNRLKNSFFDFDLLWYKYWEHKFDYITETKRITWDWQWNFHQMETRQLSIVPAVNLVTNIGFNENATHTHEEENPAANIPFQQLTFPLTHPKGFPVQHDYEEEFVKWVWCYHKRRSSLVLVKNSLKGKIKGWA